MSSEEADAVLLRRTMMTESATALLASWVVMLSGGCSGSPATPSGATPLKSQEANQDPNMSKKPSEESGVAMKIHYLEIVTKEVEAVSSLYSKMHNVTFEGPDPNLGNARTAKLAGGGMIGVRAPMHDAEKPVVRPYMLVENIEAIVAIAKQAGAVVAVPPMKLPGHGTCAIVIQNEVEIGLWQVD
ncbi:MAG: hypothetical protein U0905_21660 [Pirellulales bacterium]